MTQQPKQNGLSALIQMASSSGDRLIQMATIGLIVIANGGGIFATVREADETRNNSREEAEKAVKEIHDIHNELFAALARQKDIQNDIHAILVKLGEQPH